MGRRMVSGFALGLLLSVGTPALADARDLAPEPPAGFKPASSLARLPSFIPGLGTLYVDPATLPLGPFLGYDRQGRLVNLIYMVPLTQLQEHKNWVAQGKAVGGHKVDHTDIEYNAGHPGVAEPHYHFVQWLVPHDRHTADMK